MYGKCLMIQGTASSVGKSVLCSAFLRILKQDALDKHPIAGVQFDIYEVKADGTPGTLVARMTTDQNGVAESPALFPATYFVKEHEGPVGYLAELWSETVTIEGAQYYHTFTLVASQDGDVGIYDADPSDFR